MKLIKLPDRKASLRKLIKVDQVQEDSPMPEKQEEPRPQPAQSGNEGVESKILEYRRLQQLYDETQSPELSKKIHDLYDELWGSEKDKKETKPDIDIKAATLLAEKRQDWRSTRDALEEKSLEDFAVLADAWNSQTVKPKDLPSATEQSQKEVKRIFVKTKMLDDDLAKELEKKSEETPKLKEKIFPPDDLDPNIRSIWEHIPYDSQREIIRKHNESKQPEEKPRSVFDKKISFSLRKKSKPDQHKKKFSLFKRKQSLKNIEAYCHKCKHGIRDHQHKGRSAGCKECGCLATVPEILDINHIKFDIGEKLETVTEELICSCGHRQIVHKERGFCEEKDCFCIEFKKSEDTSK